MDPLRVVREVVMNDALSSVRIDGDTIHFGDKYSFPKKTETSYKSQRGRGAFYNLESLVYYMQYGQNARLAEYLQEANRRHLMPVSFIDRQDLVQYLTGVTEHSESIQIDVPTIPSTLEPGAVPDAADLKRQLPEDQEGDDRPAKFRCVTEQESMLKDRNSILNCAKKSFGRVLEIVNNVQKEQKMAEKAPARADAAGPSSRLPAPPDRHSGKQPPHASKPGPSQKVAPPVKGGKAAAKDAAAAGDKVGGSPIIVVPAGFSDSILLNMFNAPAFLQDGEFTLWHTLQEAGMKKPDVQTIIRSMGKDGQKPVRYHVTDKPPRKGSDDWKRVVAVFCTAAKWQFRDWPFKGAAEGDLVETFSKVAGFHLHFHDSPVHPTIKTWNVKTITLHRNARHNDRPQAATIWKTIDQFLASRKSGLNY